MTDWKAIETSIPSAVRKILGKKYDIGWNKRRARWREEGHCKLDIVSITHLGRGEIRRSITSPADGTFTERIYTPTRFTVQFTFEAQSQDLFSSAWPPAQSVSIALRRSDAFDILCASGLGINQVTALKQVDYRDQHSRWRSAVVFDVWFNAHISAALPSASGDLVEQVEATGTLTAGTNVINTTVFVDGS